jgi:hypothetical protein
MKSYFKRESECEQVKVTKKKRSQNKREREKIIITLK